MQPFFLQIALSIALTMSQASHLADVLPTAHTRRRGVTKTAKAGLAWPNADSVDMEQYLTTGKVTWYYTWSAFPTKSDLEFVPMLWGPRTVDQFTSTIQRTLQSDPGITAILGMNEPEQKGQSNMTAQEGAQFWQTYLEPLRTKGIRLGSPAMSSAPLAKVWLQDFLTACGGNCTVDFIAAHWYGTNASQFVDFVHDYHDTFQKPVWITEWACQNYVDLAKQCSKNDIPSFMNETQTFMDGADFVERYAWFGAMKNMQGVNPDDAIMDTKGNINALGKQYISAQANASISSAVIRELAHPYSSLLGVGAALSLPLSVGLLLLVASFGHIS